ncbi:MAG: hypothetical protein BWY95_00149 [Bacteroidetes bacterium ADurb.BinA104]|jgi:hypothetical protein|nr:MAG: hypothetical protein BWY95_00149 [Bacteroidetes bacterium ADurb.BinA104]
MADFHSTEQIIGTVRMLLGSLTEPKYLLRKPTKAADPAYIVINSLPINADVMQKCIVNVNYHVKDMGLGIPDLAKLEAGTTAILDILQKVTTSGFLMDFESQEIFPETALSEHFSNIRFSVKQINY